MYYVDVKNKFSTYSQYYISNIVKPKKCCLKICSFYYIRGARLTGIDSLYKCYAPGIKNIYPNCHYPRGMVDLGKVGNKKDIHNVLNMIFLNIKFIGQLRLSSFLDLPVFKIML
jgi:hypothetical protein